MLVDYVSELDEVMKGIADAKTRDSQANADYEKALREVLNRSVLSAVEEVKKNITAVKARESQAETNWKDAQQEDHPIDYMMTVINRVSALTYLSGALHAKLARLYSSTSELNNSILFAIKEVKKDIATVDMLESQAEAKWKEAEWEGRPINDLTAMINRWTALIQLLNALHTKLARLESGVELPDDSLGKLGWMKRTPAFYIYFILWIFVLFAIIVDTAMEL